MGTAAAGTSTVLGQWRFDENGGQTAVDDGPYGLDGRLGVTAEADAHDPDRLPGVSGGALRFDGSFVRLPGATELEPPSLTVEAVVRADASPGRFRYVISHGAQGCLAGSYGLYTGEHGGIGVLRLRRQGLPRRPRRPFPATSGTARGTTSRARSTARRCACSSTATRSASRSPRRRPSPMP